MDFDLKRPCPRCPFRTDCLEGWLGRERARGIVESITVGQQTFACHETTEFDDGESDSGEYTNKGGEKHCAGALLMLERSGIGVGQLARIAGRLGMVVELDDSAPVFEHPEDFIDHHSSATERPTDDAECCSVVEAGCEAPAGYAVGGGAISAKPAPEALHWCSECGEPVCENCSNDEGVCMNCTGEYG